ncbi:MAG: hypothetical protein QOG60_2722 [Frankiaceae bacterium]|nr:hypothetical protein [Frankiaceae bacterium]
MTLSVAPVASEPRRSFWSPPMALGRIAALRLVGCVFVLLDIVWWTPWVRPHREIEAFYQPLVIGRLLHLPTPTPLVVDAVGVGLVLAALAGLVVVLAPRTGRAPGWLSGRWPTTAAGVALALLYGEWMVIAMSYGKVDHDRFALLVMLAVLATVGPARLGDRSRSEAAGWAVRCVQVAVVATYLLAAVAKFRFGGFGWVNGSTLVWAIVRRGTPLGDPLLHVPQLLHLAQWGIVAIELCSPLLLLFDHLAGTGDHLAGSASDDRLAARAARARDVYLAGFLSFHVATFATISILFLPHVVCLLAFVPLERVNGGWLRGWQRQRLSGRPLTQPTS